MSDGQHATKKPGVGYGLKLNANDKAERKRERASMTEEAKFKTLRTRPGKKWQRNTHPWKGGWQRIFLAALADIPNVSYACAKAHITAPGAYVCRNRDAKFAEEWKAAIVAGVEKLEKAAWQRARDGVPHGVWMKTRAGRIKKVETVYDYSDSLAQFLLKAHKPATYREPLRESSAAITLPSGEEVRFSVGVAQEELPE